MDKFKELLKRHGVTDETINQVVSEMTAQKMYLTSEENMDIRYPKLKGDYEALEKKHNEATTLIETLKKNGTDNTDLQKKIGDYEASVKDLEGQLAKTKLESAIKVALLEAKASDVDYLTFKLREKGELTLDENGKVKNIDKYIDELKTAHPAQFESTEKPKIIIKKLDSNDSDNLSETITPEQFKAMSYKEKVKLHDENIELYNTLAGKSSNDDKE